MRIDTARFEELVGRALDGMPEWVQEQMKNVSVLVRPWPTPGQAERAKIERGTTLLGLYEGVPLTRRGRGYHLMPPDRITLFMLPLATHAQDELALEQLIRRTVVHEISHHFGFTEDQIRDLGY